jgi:hypothetical protein
MTSRTGRREPPQELKETVYRLISAAMDEALSSEEAWECFEAVAHECQRRGNFIVDDDVLRRAVVRDPVARFLAAFAKHPRAALTENCGQVRLRASTAGAQKQLNHREHPVEEIVYLRRRHDLNLVDLGVPDHERIADLG